MEFTESQVLIRAIRGPDVYGIGEKHFEIGERVAAAMSQGGAPKRYAHTDPNEDGVIAAESSAALLVAVADAHAGHFASSVAIEWLVQNRAEAWLTDPPDAEQWLDALLDAFVAIEQAIAADNARTSERSSTTLALALFDRARDRVLYGNAGDSHIFVVGDAVCDEITGETRGFFLGDASGDRDEIAAHLEHGSVDRGGAFVIVCASDGISSPYIGFDEPAEDVARIVRATPRRAEDVARALMDEACGIQQANDRGDNIAIAVAMIGSEPVPST